MKLRVIENPNFKPRHPLDYRFIRTLFFLVLYVSGMFGVAFGSGYGMAHVLSQCPAQQENVFINFYP